MFPDTIEEIGDYAFYGNNTLGSFNLDELDNLIEIGNYAFNACSALQSTLSLPSSLEIIGARAFYNCRSLRGDLTIPAGVTTIEAQTFYYCSNLSSVTIGENVQSIGGYAFFYCTDIEDISYNAVSVEDLTRQSNVFYCAGVENSGITVVFGEGVTRVPAYLFYGASNSSPPAITSVTFSSTITEIGNYSFYNSVDLVEIIFNCIELYDFTENSAFYHAGYYTNGVTVIFNEGVTRIPALMFETNYLGGTGRVHLSSVIFATTITEIGVGAFCGVGYLTGELVLPTNLESIGDGAFNYCGYNSVTIPANVSYIGIDSFANMSNLSEININAINANDIPLNSYGEPEGVFFRSGSSAGITVIFGEGVIRVPANLFYDINPPTIVSLTISSTITEIGDNAFSYCDDLNTVSFSGNSQLATIGKCFCWLHKFD